MNDVDNRLSAIDLTVPGGRFVIASDKDGNISPTAQPLLSQIPIPYATSQGGGLDSRAAATELPSIRAAGRHGVGGRMVTPW